MRIAFLVNELLHETSIYTTTMLAYETCRRGHEVFYIDLADFSIRPDGRLFSRVRQARQEAGTDAFLQAACAAELHQLDLTTLDVLMLRAEPTVDAVARPWAHSLSHLLGERLRLAGVRVLSDPRGLARAGPDKFYSLRFPPDTRPRTLVSRTLADVYRFADEIDGDMVMKPMDGGAGESVFFVRKNDPNFVQIFESVSRLGYVVAQAFLPEIAEGSIRLFMLEGEILTVDGAVAALRHVPQGREIRSNYRVSANTSPGSVGEASLRVAERVGSQLASDGLFLVGLDIVEDKILEANIYSPGGLRGAQRLAGADFCGAVVDALTRPAATAA